MSMQQDVRAIRRLFELTIFLSFMAGVARLVVVLVSYLLRRTT